MRPQRADRARVARAHLTRLLLLLAVVCLAHFNTLGNSFHFDDEHSLTENPHIRDLGNIPAFFSRSDMFSANVGSDMYRPLVLVSYALNYSVGGYEGKQTAGGGGGRASPGRGPDARSTRILQQSR